VTPEEISDPEIAALAEQILAAATLPDLFDLTDAVDEIDDANDSGDADASGLVLINLRRTLELVGEVVGVPVMEVWVGEDGVIDRLSVDYRQASLFVSPDFPDGWEELEHLTPEDVSITSVSAELIEEADNPPAPPAPASVSPHELPPVDPATAEYCIGWVDAAEELPDPSESDEMDERFEAIVASIEQRTWVADGATVYRSSCAVCHGSDGEGGVGPEVMGPGAVGLTVEEQVNVVLNGSATMPGWAVSMEDDEIAAVVAYLREQTPGS
jgi:cytochrome c5